jgi:hypothetical protein
VLKDERELSNRFVPQSTYPVRAPPKTKSRVFCLNSIYLFLAASKVVRDIVEDVDVLPGADGPVSPLPLGRRLSSLGLPTPVPPPGAALS